MKEVATKVITFVQKIKGWIKWVNVAVDTLDDLVKNIQSTFKIKIIEDEEDTDKKGK